MASGSYRLYKISEVIAAFVGPSPVHRRIIEPFC